MTTDVLRVPGNYKLEAKSSNQASITLDSPLTVITGMLTVLGTSTTIVTTNTNVTNNVIVLNSGETNNFVSAGYGGVLIARGANNSESQAATMFYNDTPGLGGAWTVGGTTNRGMFEFEVSNQASAIRIAAVRIPSASTKLNLLGNDNASATVSVTGTINYELNVTDDDDIPNKKYVDDAITASVGASGTQCIPIACSDETTALTAGVAKVTFRMPYSFVLTGVRASLTTAQTSGGIFTVDIKKNGVSILSTKITIDNGEKSSFTAAIPPVISDSALDNDSEITVDIVSLGDGTATGLKVYLIGHP